MAVNEPGIVKRLLADVTKTSAGIAEHMLALQESEQRHKDYLKRYERNPQRYQRNMNNQKRRTKLW